MSSRSQREMEFNRLLLEIIDETISSLGKPAEKAILHYTEKKFNIPSSDLSNHLEEYPKALEQLLGRGAKTLLRRIMRQICIKTQSVVLYPEFSNLEFADYISAVKSNFLANKNDVIGITLGIDEGLLAADAGAHLGSRRLA